MIDIEKLKEGTELWFLHQNRPASFLSCGINRLSTNSGLQINVVGYGVEIPADHCYSSEMELIEDQINYWRDMRLNKIVKDSFLPK